MRKLFCESNAYNVLVFVDENNRAVFFDCETIEEANSMDCSGAEGEEDIEALAFNCNLSNADIFDFSEDDFENVTEIAG